MAPTTALRHPSEVSNYQEEVEDWSDPAWPPGTVRLEVQKDDDSEHDIVLQPRPTHDPNDPLNWTKARKYLNFGLACFYALMVFAQICASTPTWGPMGDELHFSAEVLNDTYAVGCATLALGSFMLIPFALKYGLRPIYVLSSAAQLGIMIWAARTQTAGDWWGVNALQCWIGSLAEVMVQISIADIFFVHERGLMNSIYIWVANLGSSLAPVAAGFITDSQGWRWVWWWCAIFFGVDLLLFFFCFEETKFNWKNPGGGRRPTIELLPDDALIVKPNKRNSVVGRVSISLDAEKRVSVDAEKRMSVDREKTASLDPEKKGDPMQRERTLSVVQIDPAIPRKTYVQRLSLFTTTHAPVIEFARHAWQPFLILFSIPGVAYCSLVYAILLAFSTVQTAALSTYMLEPPYNFSATGIGLMNIAYFVGNTLGCLVCGPVSDWLVLKLARRNNGVYEPEMRFWTFLPFVPFQIAGNFWFGYALAGGQSWVSVAVAWGMACFGSSPLQSLALTYITDAYNEIVGDALVAVTFCRNTMSTIFVFALVPWVTSMGMANVFNIIGSLGIAILFFSGAFLWKGKHWRHILAKRYKYYAAKQFESRPIK